jgi:muramidase (phage lysozyme)
MEQENLELAVDPTRDEQRPGTATDASSNAPPPVEQNTPTEEKVAESNAKPDDNANNASTEVELPDSATLHVDFRDFACKPIEGLKFKFQAGDQVIRGTTCTEGKASPLTDLDPDIPIEVFVFREHSKDYKSIGFLDAYPGCTNYSIVSPKLKYDVETEPHEGEPGDADKLLEQPVQKIAASPAPVAAASTASAPALAPAPGPASAPVSKTSTANQSADTAKAAASKPAIQSDRNAKGHPQAVVHDSLSDWLQRKLNAVFNFWTWKDFQAQPASSSSKATSEQSQKNGKAAKTSAPSSPPTQGHPLVNPSMPATAVESGKALGDSDIRRLQQLMAFTERQISLSYGAYKDDRTPTLDILAQYAKSDTPSFPSKAPDKPLGMCQVYVKIALFRCGYTNSPGNQPQAKTSGVDWLSAGFVDVSKSLPQIEITYEEAIPPKDLPKVGEILDKRAKLKAMKGSGKTKSNPISADEIQKLEKGIPDMPATTTVKYVQPDLMYTLPGDVIVYEQVDPADPRAAGHVEIRTYHGFLSDFAVPGPTPALGGRQRPGGKKRYKVIGVYRKTSDTMAMARVKAFLKAIRTKEAEGYSEAEAYYSIPAGKDGNGKYLKRRFFDTSAHPFSEWSHENISKKDFYGRQNTSAGAYQTKESTWRQVLDATGWPIAFTPEMQDRIAIRLLQGRSEEVNGIRRTALGYVMEGKVEDAIEKTHLWNEWSCLPHGAESKYTMAQLRSDFEKYLQEFIK